MPIYEYRCQECGKTFESIQKFSAEPYETCGQATRSECTQGGTGKVDRLLGSPAFQFKGSGFYITDYTKNGGNKGATAKGEGKSEGKSENKSESKSETKTESKPAATTSTKSD